MKPNYDELLAENERLVGSEFMAHLEASELKARNLALVAALKKYGRHTVGCELDQEKLGTRSYCADDCGFEKALSPSSSMEALREIVNCLRNRFHDGKCLNCGFPAFDCLHTCEWRKALTTAEKQFGIKV